MVCVCVCVWFLFFFLWKLFFLPFSLFFSLFFSLYFFSVWDWEREREWEGMRGFFFSFSLSLSFFFLLIGCYFFFTFLVHEIPLSEKLFGLVCFCWKHDVKKSVLILSIYSMFFWFCIVFFFTLFLCVLFLLFPPQFSSWSRENRFGWFGFLRRVL
jgi:hypothetical protein